jgi:Flp pilus assembly pilin Flp
LQYDRMPSKHWPAGMSGQSLAEYGMVIGLVAAVGIAAVALLGGSLQDGLASINGGNATPSTLAITDSPPGMQSPPPVSTNQSIDTPISAALRAMLPPPGPGQEQACFQSGYCVNLPVVDAMTVTSGANGIQLTYQFASVIEQIASQLRDAPDTDPQLVALVTELANSGHDLGAKEQYLLDNYATTESQNNNTPIIQGVNKSLGVVTTKHQALQSYLTTYPSALPPELQNIISLEVDQISTIARNGFKTFGSYTDPETGKSLNAPAIVNGVQLTHQSSNTICGSGGDTGVCVQPVASAGS